MDTNFQGYNQLLRHLVLRADTTEFGISVTLNIHGTVVTGEIISEKSFLNSIGNLIDEFHAANAKDEEELDTVKEHFREFINQIISDKSDYSNNDFIHLQNAAVYPDGHNPMHVGMWRGKITSIDGFSIGYIPSEPAEENA